jgi:dTDP-4-amino-4,6-dideoxygalactose transaminase
MAVLLLLIKKKLFNKIKIIRNHGLKNRDLVTLEGRNSRLDNLQAIVGILNLSNLNNIIKQRNVNANIYNQNFKKYEKFIKIPNLECCGKIKHTYHRYVIRCRFRNKLKNFLNTKKIETKIHYPVNLHQQKPFKKYYRHNLPVTNKFNKQILSLPIHEHITKKEIFYIIKNVKNFYNKYTTSK